MINIIIAGAAGRMGQRIVHMVHQNTETALAGAFELPGHPSIGKDAGVVAGVGDLGVKIAGTLEEVIDRGDVLIDFTAPEATLKNLKAAASRGKRQWLLVPPGLKVRCWMRLKPLPERSDVSWPLI